MKIATPAGWDGEKPTAPRGFTVTALATGLAIPRQTLVLPNGDILVAEGSGGGAPALRPKDVIATYIKAMGKSSVKGGNRVTLLRDADNDGRAELRTSFITGLRDIEIDIHEDAGFPKFFQVEKIYKELPTISSLTAALGQSLGKSLPSC